MFFGALILALHISASCAVAERLHITFSGLSRGEVLPQRGGVTCETDDEGCIGGVSRFVSFLRALRAREPHVLALDLGSNIGTGSPFFSHHGVGVFSSVWNSVGFDAHAISPRDFIRGPDTLRDLAEQLSPTGVLGTTLDVRRMELDGYVSKLLVRETRGGMKVGVVSWFSEEVAFGKSGNLVVADLDAAVIAREASVAKVVHGASVVVLLAAKMKFNDTRHIVAETDVDLVLVDHEEDIPPAGYTVVDPVNGDVQGFVMGCKSCVKLEIAPVVTMDLGVEPRVANIVFTEMSASAGVPLAADISAVVDPLRRALFVELNDPISTALSYIEGGRSVCRLGECAGGVFTTDTMLWWANDVAGYPTATGRPVLHPGVDAGGPPFPVAIVNSGGIRASIAAGPFSEQNVMTMLPFTNNIVLQRVSGRVLVEALTRSFDDWVSANATGSGGGYFLQVGENLDVEWSASAQRLVSVRVKHDDGEFYDVHYAQSYDMLVLDFVAGGGDGYTMLKDIPAEMTSADVIGAVAIAFIKAKSSPVDFRLRGNIRVVPEWRELRILCPDGFVNVTDPDPKSENEALKFFYSCSACSAGEYKKDPKTCVVCPVGNFSGPAAHGQCESCPAGATTALAASKNLTDCGCKSGFYGDPTNSSTPCTPCPEGGICPGRGLLPEVAEGFYRSPLDPLIFRRCLPEEACPTGQTQTPCATGFEGTNCGLCSEGFYRSSGDCRTCPNVHGGVVTVVIVCILVVIVSFFILSSFGRSEKGRRRRAMAGIIVAALQDLALLPTYLPGTWPSGLSPIFVFSGLFNLSFDVIGVECYGFHFDQIYVLKMLIPVAFAATLAVIYGLHTLYLRRRGEVVMQLGDYYIAAFILFLSFSYTYLSSSILDMVDCVRHPDGTAFLLQSPADECFTPAYWSRLPAVISAIIIYVVGIPLFLSAVLYRHRHNFSSSVVAIRYQMIVDVFRPHCQSMAIITLVYKFLFVFVKIVLTSSSVIRPVVGLLLAGSFAMYKFRARPMRDALVRQWDVMHIGVSCALIFGLTLYSKELSQTELIVLGVGVVLATIPLFGGTALLAGLYGIALFRFIGKVTESKRAKDRARQAGGTASEAEAAKVQEARRVSMFFTPAEPLSDLTGTGDSAVLHVEIDETIKEPWGSKFTPTSVRVGRQSTLFNSKSKNDMAEAENTPDPSQTNPSAAVAAPAPAHHPHNAAASHLDLPGFDRNQAGDALGVQSSSTAQPNLARPVPAGEYPKRDPGVEERASVGVRTDNEISDRPAEPSSTTAGVPALIPIETDTDAPHTLL